VCAEVLSQIRVSSIVQDNLVFITILRTQFFSSHRVERLMIDKPPFARPAFLGCGHSFFCF
jgi:hypothetical protein